MRINCTHGDYKFYPESLTDIPRLKSLHGIELVKKGDYFTFKELADLKNYMIKGELILGFEVKKTCEGDLSFMFKENDCFFDVNTRKIIAKESIVKNETALSSVLYYIMGSLIPQAGAFVGNDQKRLVSFDGSIDGDTATLRCREINLG